MMKRYHEGALVMRECAAKGIAVHNAGTFATGLLAGGYTFVYGDAPAGANPTLILHRLTIVFHPFPLRCCLLHIKLPLFRSIFD